MIDWIDLTNFQRFTKLRLNLKPGLNVIVGDSDVGKSTLIRAVRWVCLGGPVTGLRRFGQESVRVALSVDSVRLSRIRDAERNVYRLDGKLFEAVGVQVPGEVSRFLRMTDLHFQGQMDPPFLLGSSPLEAARLLNRVISLDLIDSTLSNLDSEARRAKVSLSHKTTEVRECEEALARTEWVVEAKECLDLADSLEQQLGLVESEIRDLVDYQGRLASCPEQTPSAPWADDPHWADGYRGRIDEFVRCSAAVRSLRNHLYSVEEAERRLCSTMSTMREAEEDLHKFRLAPCPLCGAGPSS